MSKRMQDVSRNARQLFERAQGIVTKSSSLQQLAIGTVSGWTTGFLFTRIGKVGAISVGGSIILLSFANEAGLIKIDWSKVTKKCEESATKITQHAPQIKASVSKYGKSNTTLVVGFVGGFLLGIVS